MKGKAMGQLPLEKINAKAVIQKSEHKENLQLVLKEAFIYHRDALSMVFKVTFTFGTIFAGLMAVYITLSSGTPSSEFQKMRHLVAWVGVASAIFAAVAQRLSIQAYQLSGKVYLRPLRRELGLQNTPTAGLKSRAKIERQVAIALYLINVLYTVAWLWVLINNHSLFGLVGKAPA